MYHSITFRTSSGIDYNTWSNWHLIPASRPTIAHPEMVITSIKIPGRTGSIDLTNYLYSQPIYKDRTGSFEFYVMEGYSDQRLVLKEMLEILHGKKVKIFFEDDPGYYYVGRIKIDKWQNEASRPTATISYIIEPYKYDSDTNEQILDDF